jgi:hypothetical protein
MSATLTEIDQHWSWDDVLRANAVLDYEYAVQSEE